MSALTKKQLKAVEYLILVEKQLKLLWKFNGNQLTNLFVITHH